MAFIDIQFPTGISYGATGGPKFSTSIAVTNGGQESRNQNWSYELAEYEVAHAARLPADWRQLQAFFRIVGGRANTFRFKDHLDYSATAAEGLFVMIDATHWQMIKRYTFGAQTYDRKITKPVNGTITTGGTVDYSTGIVTGTPTSWAGQFDVHARFGTDQMKAETINRQGDGSYIVGWQSIPVIEVR